jgi:Xaa-Pro aminopeptidase
MTSRLDRTRTHLAELGIEQMLITTPSNVRWLSGFTAPEDARILIQPSEAVLLTDGRYIAQAQEESSLPAIIERDWMGVVRDRLTPGHLAVEGDHLTLAAARRLEQEVGRSLAAHDGVLEPLRIIKEESEVDAIRRAAQLTDEAFAHALTLLKPGVREVDLALAIEHYVRTHGGEGMAFDIIVASGPRSAMPHGTASSRSVQEGELVTFDLGAKVDGYCADMTRTVAVGAITPAHRAIFDAVLTAQERAVAAIRPGIGGAELDAVARDALTEAGFGEAFSHSLGHGVGIDIHEAPGLSPKSETVLEPGMVITIEPGAYLPGDAGVRIEDLVRVTESGGEVLSSSPKAFLDVLSSS